MISSFKKKKRDGFTLVELLVVIAILAVLASVSVIGYLGFTKKAKVSNDVSLTTQMNRILQAEEAGGETFNTPHDAITALKEGGLDVTKLTPTTDGYNYVYDVNGTNGQKMILVDENKSVIAPEGASIDSSKAERYFFFAGSESEVTTLTTAGWSVYLKDDFSLTSTALSVSAGLDVGDNVISTINYINETKKSAIIRTASYDTTLNIYGPKDIIKHSGLAKEINIAEVAMSSYHEFGDVLGNLNVAKGNVELEKGSSVSNVVIKEVTNPKTNEAVSPSSKEEVKVEVKEDASVTTIQSASKNVKASDVTSGEGASEVSKVDVTENIGAIIGSTTYETYIKALAAAKTNDVITLLKDATTSDNYNYANVKGEKQLTALTVDLNGYTLNSKTICSGKGGNDNFTLILKNGNLKINDSNGVVVDTNCSLEMYGVNLEGSTYGIFPCGDSSHVNIYNSNIKAAAGIATNAGGTLSNNVKVNIESSVIDASGKGAETAVWTNVPSNYYINNSILKGNLQALMVRAGTAVVKNSQLILTNGGSANANTYMNSVWSGGNNIPHGALIVGDWNSSYNNKAQCDLENTKLSTTISGWNRALTVLAQDGNTDTVFNYDSACELGSSNYVISNTGNLKKGQITVNGVVVQSKEK